VYKKESLQEISAKKDGQGIQYARKRMSNKIFALQHLLQLIIFNTFRAGLSP
jgi:hypothetical protein